MNATDKKRRYQIDKIKQCLGVENVFTCDRQTLVDVLCNFIDTNTKLMIELYKGDPDNEIFEGFSKLQKIQMEMTIKGVEE